MEWDTDLGFIVHALLTTSALPVPWKMSLAIESTYVNQCTGASKKQTSKQKERNILK